MRKAAPIAPTASAQAMARLCSRQRRRGPAASAGPPRRASAGSLSACRCKSARLWPSIARPCCVRRPGVSDGTRNTAESPSGRLAVTRYCEALAAPRTAHLCPSSTYPSPSGRARVRKLTARGPAAPRSGSDRDRGAGSASATAIRAWPPISAPSIDSRCPSGIAREDSRWPGCTDSARKDSGIRVAPKASQTTARSAGLWPVPPADS